MLKIKVVSLLIAMIMLVNVTSVTGIGISAVQRQAIDKTLELQKNYDSQLPDLLKEYGVPGVILTIIDGDKVWVKGYGYADKATKNQITKDTVFQVGSISKTVTAWGAMKLVDEGKIELDAPIEKYLRRWHLPKSQYSSEGVTLRRILSHTAGLSLQSYAGVVPSKNLATIEESLSGNTYGAENVKIINEPGSRFQYSGGGYTLLQLVIEEVSGMPFEKYMEQEILKPLGMNNSAYEWKEEFKPNMSKAYGVLGQALPNYIFAEKAAAGLYTTAADLVKFGMAAMNMSDGRSAGRGILKPETVALMTKNVPNAKWGLGYQIIDLPNGDIAIGHKGANRGWRAELIEIPDNKQGLVVLTNSDMGDKVCEEVTSIWIEQQTGKLPNFYNVLHRTNRNVLILAAILGFIFIVYFALVVRSIAIRKRQYIYFADMKKWKKLLRILMPVLIAVVWCIGLYGPIIHGWNIAEFLPIATKWITLIVTLWCILLLIIAVFPTKRLEAPKHEQRI